MADPSSEETDGSHECTRCGRSLTGEQHYISKGSHYEYCNTCCEEFEHVQEQGVTVRSRHGNREFHRFPYDAPKIDREHPQNQTKALAAGLKAIREKNVPGLFIYQKTGSYWLIDEYLDAHPSIAEDVEACLESVNSRRSLTDYLPF